jgi:YesN/AraC family two-component response regulator
VSQREEDVMEALKLKMNFYLAKPITHQKLSVLVKSIYELQTDLPAGDTTTSEKEETHIRLVLACNPHTAPSVLRKLASDDYAKVRAHVAENPETPADVLEFLADDPSEEVRMSIAENPQAPESILRKLASDTSDDVRLSLANSSKLPPDVLESLAEDQNPFIVDAARKALTHVGT